MHNLCENIYLNRNVIYEPIYRNKESFIILIQLLLDRDRLKNYVITSYKTLAIKLEINEDVIKKSLHNLQKENLIEVYKQPYRKILIAIRPNENFYLIDGEQIYLD